MISDEGIVKKEVFLSANENVKSSYILEIHSDKKS